MFLRQTKDKPSLKLTLKFNLEIMFQRIQLNKCIFSIELKLTNVVYIL